MQQTVSVETSTIVIVSCRLIVGTRFSVMDKIIITIQLELCERTALACYWRWNLDVHRLR